jgi:hypothetical protein
MVKDHMDSVTEGNEGNEEWEGSVLDYASPYRTKDKKANEAYPINSARAPQGPLEELKKSRISGTEALEQVFKNRYLPYAIASVPQYKADKQE